jgi:2-iminobutanoate/2-iminopropanoate deaminase
VLEWPLRGTSKEDLVKREAVSIPGAPKPVGPFSPAIKAAGMVFASGQLPLDAKGAMPEGIVAQTGQCLENLKAVFEAAGTNLGNVVKCTVFIKNMDDFAKMNEVYASFFPQTPPARSTVEVSRLARNALIEIEAIALA